VKTQNNQLLWQGQAYNARGQITSYLQGTGLQTTKYYDDYGFPTNEYTWGQVDNTYAYNTYDFDEMKGNLLSRTDHLAGGGNGKTESFT
jgi:YD repeat-containing protein